MSDEQCERPPIAEQIEYAKATSPDLESVEEGMKREEGAEKVILSFPAKPVAPTTTASSGSLKFNANPLKAGTNPLKQPNVLKTAAPTLRRQPRPLLARNDLLPRKAAYVRGSRAEMEDDGAGNCLGTVFCFSLVARPLTAHTRIYP